MSEDKNSNARDPIIHIIHHDDPDGICAAAIVLLALNSHPSGNSPRFMLYPVNYNHPVDVSRMADGDRVVIVDFSYPPAEMAKIEEAIIMPQSIYWIDHHKTAEAYGYQYKGLRDFSDKGQSGCELAWAYFFPNRPFPLAVRLIGDYDSWRLSLTESKCFHEGIKMLCPTPRAELWHELLYKNSSGARSYVQNVGSYAMQYRDAYCARMRQSHGYPTTLAGHPAYALNVYGFGSQAFGDLFTCFPLVIAYVHDGRRFTCSLYSETVDVGAIAKKLGGGGHKGAAGFVCDVLPFKPEALFAAGVTE